MRCGIGLKLATEFCHFSLYFKGQFSMFKQETKSAFKTRYSPGNLRFSFQTKEWCARVNF